MPRVWVVIAKWKDGREVCYGPFVSREVASLLQFAGYSGSMVDNLRVYEVEQP